jgi:hypothetical protein
LLWTDLCYPKKEGGLGLKDLEVWNHASMLRHVWNLFARSGSIWVAWIKENILKNKSFWDIGVSQNSSWCWRKLLKLRVLAKHFLKFDVGDGENIHLWLDHWHLCGILFDSYGFRVVYDAQSRLKAKVSSVIKNKVWYWKAARSNALVDIQSRLPEIKISACDIPIWSISKKGSYVCSDT